MFTFGCFNFFEHPKNNDASINLHGKAYYAIPNQKQYEQINFNFLDDVSAYYEFMWVIYIIIRYKTTFNVCNIKSLFYCQN